MEGERPRKRAKGPEFLEWLEENELASSKPETCLYDLGDCLHEVATHLPLNSCLRSRLVSKAFALAFGWSVREIMQIVSNDSAAVVRDLQRCSQAYPAAESLLLVLDKYDDMPRLQAIAERLKLEGPSAYKQMLERSAGPTSGPAAGPSADAETPAGPGPVNPSGCSSLAHYPRRSPRLTGSAAAASRGSAAAGAAAKATAPSVASSDDASRRGGSAAAPDLELSRVTRLAIRCNISSSDVAKERVRYKDTHSRRPVAPLLQLLGLPPALLDMMHEHEQGPDGPGGAASAREGHGINGPMQGEELLDLAFLARMPALSFLRLAVPLDLRPQSARSWMPGPGATVGGLGAVAALRQLRRLDLLPINGLTSADIAPLGDLGGSLEHLELYLDDAPTLHWHRRPEGYEAPDPSHMQLPGPFAFMTGRRMRDYEYATRVHPAWTRLNELLARLPRLCNLNITGTAPFWLPMGQFLLGDHPNIANLHLSCTSSPSEFTASPLPEQQQQQQRTQQEAGGAQASSATGAAGPAPRPMPGQGSAWPLGKGTQARSGRHLRVVMRHAENHTLLEDAKQLLPLQPLLPQDEVSVDICGMGAVQPELGTQVKELVAALPVRSLVMVHCTWTDPRVATEVIGALSLGDTPASGIHGPTRRGLRRLQLWSRDKEAFEASNRVLTASNGRDAEGCESGVDGHSAPASSSLSSGPQELVIHGVLPDTLGPLLPPSLKRLSLANRTDSQQPEGPPSRRQAILQVSCLPEGLEALDMHNMTLLGNVTAGGLPQLSSLSLHSCALSDLDQLELGPRLKRLLVFRNTIVRSSMERLVDRCPGIVELSLQEAFSPDASHRRLQMSAACSGLIKDVHHISRLTRLETLSLPILNSCDAMTSIVPHLKDLPSLSSLLVQGLWDMGVPALACLTALQRLEWLKLHMVVDPRYFSLNPPAPGSAASGPSPSGAGPSGQGQQPEGQRPSGHPGQTGEPGPSGQGPRDENAATRQGRQRQRKGGSPTKAQPPVEPEEAKQPQPRGRRRGAGPSTAAAGEPGAEATAKEAGVSSEHTAERRRVTRSSAARATAAAASARVPAAKAEARDPQRRSSRIAAEPDGLASKDASTTAASGAGGPSATTAAAKATGAKRARAAASAAPAPKRRRGNAGGALPAPAAESSVHEPSGSSDDEHVNKRQVRRCRRAPSTGRAASAAKAGVGEAASSAGGGAGPSKPAGVQAGGAGGDALQDAHTVSRELYEALTRNLPHTRIAMKLITITFKTVDERPGGVNGGGGGGGNGGGGGGGGGPPHGAANAGPGGDGNAGGGGDGGGGGNNNGAGAVAAAAMLAGLQGAGGNAGGGAGGGGGGPGPVADGPADGAGLALEPGMAPDGPAAEALDDALGDMGMLLFGFAMAAMGMPQLELGAGPGPPAGAEAAPGGGEGGPGGGGDGGPGAAVAAAAGAAPAAAQQGQGDAAGGGQHHGGDQGGGGAGQGQGQGGPAPGGIFGCHIM